MILVVKIGDGDTGGVAADASCNAVWAPVSRVRLRMCLTQGLGLILDFHCMHTAVGRDGHVWSVRTYRGIMGMMAGIGSEFPPTE